MLLRCHKLPEGRVPWVLGRKGDGRGWGERWVGGEGFLNSRFVNFDGGMEFGVLGFVDF